jgi:hypothetical protein
MRQIAKTSDKRPIVKTPDRQVAAHRDKIVAAWGKTISGFVETGNRLIDAKRKLRGRWTKLFEGEDKLPFSLSMADRLMAIARNPVLSDSAHGPSLPASWRTLATLARAESKQLKQWLAEGKVHAEIERSEAEKLVGTRTIKFKVAYSTVNLAVPPSYGRPVTASAPAAAPTLRIVKEPTRLAVPVRPDSSAETERRIEDWVDQVKRGEVEIDDPLRSRVVKWIELLQTTIAA